MLSGSEVKLNRVPSKKIIDYISAPLLQAFGNAKKESKKYCQNGLEVRSMAAITVLNDTKSGQVSCARASFNNASA